MTKIENIKAVVAILVGTALFAISFVFITPVHAATYAYVDSQGEVRSVVANDWRVAIATAPNIHIHSGVLLLRNAADQDIIGDNVAMVR